MAKKLILSPRIIYNKLSKKVIGQDKVKKTIANAVFMHYLKCYRLACLEKPYGPKSNVLIVGPTGCGKTHMIKTLEEIVEDIPILHLDATALTNYGFQGNSLEDYLLDWKYKQGEVMADYGIVFIDELDKLCTPMTTTKSENWTAQLQQGLLKLVEGTIVSERGQTIDTSNILFIFGGNFSELRKRIKEQNSKRGIGFKLEAPKIVDLERIHTELTQSGLITELAGRISTIVEVGELSRKELRDIFYNEYGPYYNYIDLLSIIGEDIFLSEYYVNKILDVCLKTKTGARGLQTALDEFLEKKIFELPDVDFSPQKE